jgi:hypothetical protein
MKDDCLCKNENKEREKNGFSAASSSRLRTLIFSTWAWYLRTGKMKFFLVDEADTVESNIRNYCRNTFAHFWWTIDTRGSNAMLL